MRHKLMQWICCPACGSSLALDVFETDHDEILAGSLQCEGCRGVYPIIRGVPRLLTGEMLTDLQQLYADYFQRYGERFTGEPQTAADGALEKKRQTQSRFGYEWTEFDDYACDNFSSFIEPLPEGYFQGKLGLDVGCGAGRHICRAAQSGAEMIGVDLSQAVDAAYLNNLEQEQVHIVQADVYRLPFNRQQFDFIYSLGVLHHLPDPKVAYHQLPVYLKAKGGLFVWLYAYMPRKVMLELLRAVAQRLSNRNIHRMAWLCNLIDYGLVVNGYKLLSKLPRVGSKIERWAPLRVVEYAGHGYQVSLTDWYDRLSAPITNYYKKPEMERWLQESPLTHHQLLSVGDSWWWLYGEAD